MILSKSNYIFFLQHPAYLWLRIFDKHKLPPIDEATQDVFDAGNLFESYVEKLYPEAVKVGFEMGIYNGPKSYNSMPRRTKETLDADTKIILQGRLEANNITCIFDVLKKAKGEENNVYDLVEVKSSSSAKVEHGYDLAFQKLVLEGAGLTIRNCSVIHLNADYVRDGEINLKELSVETDVTDEVNALGELTKEKVKEAFNILELDTRPDLSPRYINKLDVVGTKWKYYWMKIFLYLNKDLPKTSIYNICWLNTKLIETLEDMNIEDIADIPEDLKGLNQRQLNQIQAAKSGKQTIDKGKIKEFITDFKYPLYFFDYETLSSVIPRYDGMKPYKDYPFQYSLHILDSPDAELRHEEYLHDKSSNPVPDLIKKLKKDIGQEGTILSWHSIYEEKCNERMAEIYPEHKKFLLNMNEHMIDLKIPFSEGWFTDPRFYGSASIKHVLPALVPELAHSDLEVSEGLHARRLWTKTILDEKGTWTKEKTLKELSDYCTLDTFAMVRLFEELKRAVSG